MGEDVSCRKGGGEEGEEVSFTKGPWTTEFNDCGDVDTRCKGGWQIVGPDLNRPHGFRHKEDATLIAAAPELLEALKAIEFGLSTLVYTAEVHNGLIDTARAVINKAEGREGE